MLIRMIVPNPSRTSSTRPPASSTSRRAASSEAGSRMARRLDRPAGMPASAGRASARIGGSADTSRGVGWISANGRMVDSACSKWSKLANSPCQSWRGSRRDRGPGDDAGGAVVVEVGRGLGALDVHEAGVGDGVDDVEGAHEVAGVHHPVLDRAGPARSAGQEPADRGPGRRRVQQDLLAGVEGGPLELDERGAGVGGDGAVDDLGDGAGAGHVQHQPARHRDGLAVVAGALAPRGDRHAVTHRGGDGGGDLLGVGRAGDDVGPPERQLLADHR